MLRMTLVFTGFAFTVHVPADEKEHGAQHEGEGSEDEAKKSTMREPVAGFQFAIDVLPLSVKRMKQSRREGIGR